MNEVLLANIFFIITGAAVLVVGTLLCFACYYIIKIVKTAQALLERIETSADLLLDDVQTLRDHLANGNIFGRILTAVVSAILQTKQTRAPTRKKNLTKEE